MAIFRRSDENGRKAKAAARLLSMPALISRVGLLSISCATRVTTTRAAVAWRRRRRRQSLQVRRGVEAG